MSATLVPLATAAWTPPQREFAADAAIAATRATTFLRAQAQWLRRGLDNASDRVLVGVVMAAHDRSHDRWVGVIGHVERALGDEAALEVAAVYSYLGRVAGSLDGGALEMLSPDVAASARTMLSQRLTELAEHAVETLWRVAAEV